MTIEIVNTSVIESEECCESCSCLSATEGNRYVQGNLIIMMNTCVCVCVCFLIRKLITEAKKI